MVWELPFGRGKRYGMTSRRGGGHVRWLADCRHQHDDQRPARQPSLQPATAGQVSIATSPNLRPNVIGEVVTPDGGPANYLDRTALETPPTTAPFGNAPRNSVRSPWFRQLDLGMHKTFDLGWQGTVSRPVSRRSTCSTRRTSAHQTVTSRPTPSGRLPAPHRHDRSSSGSS